MANVRNIYRYAVKHYVEHRNNYLALLLGMFGLPLLLAYMSKGVESAGVMATFVFLLEVLYVTYLSTYAMRTKGKFVLENTLPLTSTERYAFIFINSIVVAPMMFALSYVPSFLIAEWFFPPTYDVNALLVEAVVDVGFIVGLFALQSVILITSLLIRKRVFAGYLVLLALIVVCEFMVDAYVYDDLRDVFRFISNIVLIVTCWVSGYFILRSREIKI